MANIPLQSNFYPNDSKIIRPEDFLIERAMQDERDRRRERVMSDRMHSLDEWGSTKRITSRPKPRRITYEMDRRLARLMADTHITNLQIKAVMESNDDIKPKQSITKCTFRIDS